MNLLQGTRRQSNGSAYVEAPDGTHLPLPGQAPGSDGQPVLYGVRPEHLALSGENEGMAADINVVEPTGSEMLVVANLAGMEIQSAFHERHSFQSGQRIYLQPQLQQVHLFDADNGRRLV